MKRIHCSENSILDGSLRKYLYVDDPDEDANWLNCPTATPTYLDA
ncbi:hypothetical protein [Fodinibius sp.]|nr:hypothetical protein [Fodinibius sp.]